MSDRYVKVLITVVYAGRDAVKIDGEKWIPYSLLFATDEKRIREKDNPFVSQFDILVQIREWKAQQLGLKPERK